LKIGLDYLEIFVIGNLARLSKFSHFLGKKRISSEKKSLGFDIPHLAYNTEFIREFVFILWNTVAIKKIWKEPKREEFAFFSKI